MWRQADARRVVLRRGVAGVRNRRAGEVQRDVVPIDDDLHDVGIEVLGAAGEPRPQRTHDGGGVGGQRRHDLIDHRRA